MLANARMLFSGASERGVELVVNLYGALNSDSLTARFYTALIRGLARHSHWLLRLPLAALIWGYGVAKFPSALTNPGDFGVPATLYVLNAFGEVLGVIALLVGGAIESWNPQRTWVRLYGDLLTRAAGFALAAAIAGVIAFFLWETITLSNSHTMQLGLAAFFLLRGNKLGELKKGVEA